MRSRKKSTFHAKNNSFEPLFTANLDFKIKESTIGVIPSHKSIFMARL